jgi:hypothetical protein
MKKRFFSLVMAVTIIASGMLTTACASLIYKMAGIPVNPFMDPAVPVEEHAVLIIDKKLTVVRIDDKAAAIMGKTLLVLPPGEHTLLVYYVDVSVNFNGGGYKTTESNVVALTDTFLPGHFYWIDYAIDVIGTVTFRLNDETNPEIYEKKSAQNAARRRNDAARKKLRSAVDS